MKSLKKLVGLFVLAGTLAFTGCTNPVTTKISPVEDSGERVSGTAISCALPKGWEKIDDPTGYDDGFTIKKGLLNSVVIAVQKDIAQGDITLEGFMEPLKSTLVETGFAIDTAEIRDYSFGKGIFMGASVEITDEFVNSLPEDQKKEVKGLVGQKANEGVVYFFKGTDMIVVEASTFGDDASGVQEVAEFIANSIELQ